jgi:TonB family protein
MYRPVSFLLGYLLLTILSLSAGSPAGSQDRPSAVTLTPQQLRELHDLAGRVLQHAGNVGCKKDACTILVVNFTGPSDSTSLLGIQLADALSSQLLAQSNGIRVVDRTSLQSFLGSERIRSKVFEEEQAAGWLASELSASAVLVGTLMKEGSGVRIHVRLLNAQDALRKEKKKEKAPSEELVLSVENPESALAPAEPFGELFAADTTSQGEKLFRAGVNGVTMPRCYSMPDPKYSDLARSARFNGSVVLEVTIMVDESVADVRLIRGAPFGLNDSAREAVANWKCKPAASGGTPVPTRVPIEVTFRVF